MVFFRIFKSLFFVSAALFVGSVAASDMSHEEAVLYYRYQMEQASAQKERSVEELWGRLKTIIGSWAGLSVADAVFGATAAEATFWKGHARGSYLLALLCLFVTMQELMLMSGDMYKIAEYEERFMRAQQCIVEIESNNQLRRAPKVVAVEKETK